MKDKICKCGHPLSEHFDPSYECGHALEPDLVDGLSNWKEDPRQGIDEKEL